MSIKKNKSSYNTLNDFVMYYNTIYKDITLKFKKIDIDFFILCNSNNTKLFEINLSKLTYNKYRAYKLFKIFNKFSYGYNEKSLVKRFNSVSTKDKLSYISNTELLFLENNIYSLKNFIRDITVSTFEDNCKTKWKIMKCAKI